MTPAIAKFRRAVLKHHRSSDRDFPWRSETDPFRVLIAEVMLQRTRGEHVQPVYLRFLKRWPTPTALSRAAVVDVANVLAPLGLPARASVMIRLARAVVEHGGVPLEPAELANLPGIGRYGAHAVPVFAANCDLPLVDFVIARVLRRYFGLPEGGRPSYDEALWRLAADVAHRGRAREVWLGALDLGAQICKPKPRCKRCPLRGDCSFASTVLTQATRPSSTESSPARKGRTHVG